jgi:hypothetical protein
MAAAQVGCPHCGKARRHKDTRTIVVRSLFGTLRLASPRWWHCPCAAAPTRTLAPLAAALPDRTTPELAYLQARFAGLISYGMSAKLLGELLPLGRRLHPTVVRRRTHTVAQRLENELGDERWSFIDTCQLDREELPRPDLPLVVGLDGGYVHSSQQRHAATDGSRSSPAKRSPSMGGRPVSDTYRPTTPNPNADCSRYSNPRAWRQTSRSPFSPTAGRTSGISLLSQPPGRTPTGLVPHHHADHRHDQHGQIAAPSTPDPEFPAAATGDPATEIGAELERLKWFLRHGNVFRALATVEDITTDLDIANPNAEQAKLGKAVREFDTYLRANAGRIPNYGERRRAGEAISTAFVESAVNQVISKRLVNKQQMRWTPRGAYLLLQIRTRVLNDQLAGDFHRWYPGFTQAPDAATLAA